MSDRHDGARLPNGFAVFENSFGEFVVCETECSPSPQVAQVARGSQRPWNVKCGTSVEEAVGHYLDGLQAA